MHFSISPSCVAYNKELPKVLLLSQSRSRAIHVHLIYKPMRLHDSCRLHVKPIRLRINNNNNGAKGLKNKSAKYEARIILRVALNKEPQ